MVNSIHFVGIPTGTRIISHFFGPAMIQRMLHIETHDRIETMPRDVPVSKFVVLTVSWFKTQKSRRRATAHVSGEW